VEGVTSSATRRGATGFTTAGLAAAGFGATGITCEATTGGAATAEDTGSIAAQSQRHERISIAANLPESGEVSVEE
jgi:hypothetical protein